MTQTSDTENSPWTEKAVFIVQFRRQIVTAL